MAEQARVAPWQDRWRTGRAVIGASGVVAALAMAAVGFAPLVAGPGYESALVAGLILPSVAAVGAAWRVGRVRPEPGDALAIGLTRGLVVALVALAVVMLHGARVGFCGLGDGLPLWVLGPGAGSLVAGLWGAVAGMVAAQRTTPARRDAAAVLLALAGPMVSALVSGARFYSSPMVFAFDPFVGFFSGTLYDTVIDGTDRLITYRLGSLATALTAFGIAAHWPAKRARGWLTVGTLVALVASLGVTLGGTSLGHYQTTASIRASLGAQRRGTHCEVVYPAELRERDAELFTRDCDQQVVRVSEFLGVPPPPVTAFLFADSAQKRRLMGAAETYIAKPWRREVYLQVSGYPHPILGHELAHVVAGDLGRGPFKVAGALRGVLPDPGLVEGLAVAASPDDDELSPGAWSRAMLEQGLLPPLTSLFSLGFYGHDSGRAYTVAGAFVGWMRGRWGAPALGRWYGGEPLTDVVGQSWTQLETAFREHLRSLDMPPEALALARSRFDRPSVFLRRCPHEVDARKREAGARLGAGDLRGALRSLDAAALLAPRDPSAALMRATCDERLDRVNDSVATLSALLVDDAAGTVVRNRAEERLGDLALVRNDLAEARRRHDAVAARVLDEDQLRTLDVKRLATDDALARAAVIELLIGTPPRGPDALSAAEALARWNERSPTDGAPLYLLGRAARLRGLPERARELLSAALDHPVASARINREAARQLVIAGCELSDRATIARGLAAWQAAGAPPGNRDALLRTLAERCVR